MRFSLKHSKNGKATLYVVIDQNKAPVEFLEQTKKTEVVKTDSLNDTRQAVPRSVEFNIPQIVPFVKNKDLLRYIPDDMLNISREGETNTISHSGENSMSELGLAGIRELIEKAVLLDFEVHEHHKNNAKTDLISFDHKLYALGKSTDGSIALYKITVEEYFQSKSEPENKRFHNLRYIEKVADVGGRTSEESRSGGSTNDISATVYRVYQIYLILSRPTTRVLSSKSRARCSQARQGLILLHRS